MSDGGDEKPPPVDAALREEMRKHNLVFDRPEVVVQTVHRQNRSRTGDKNSGRKPSANHSTKEDESMNQGTSVVGRDVAGGEGTVGVQVRPEDARTVQQQMDWIVSATKRNNDLLEENRRIFSVPNVVKAASVGLFTAGFGWGIYGIVSLFKGPSEVIPVKPAVMGK